MNLKRGTEKVRPGSGQSAVDCVRETGFQSVGESKLWQSCVPWT